MPSRGAPAEGGEGIVKWYVRFERRLIGWVIAASADDALRLAYDKFDCSYGAACYVLTVEPRHR